MVIKRISGLLKKPFLGSCHITPLISIRILFGLLIAFSTIRFMSLGWVEEHFTCPDFHFKYFGFEWISVPNTTVVYALHILLILSSLCVALGLFYRVSALATFLLFSYIQLWDATYYLNHYYFISLFALLMMVLPAHASFSIDLYRRPRLFSNRVPSWTISVLKLQLAVVYIFAGIAKINAPWLLEALPLKMWLPSRGGYFFLGNLFQQEWTAYAFSWIGMLYDVFIVFLLLNKRTRMVGFMLVVVFHLLTRWLFPIGVFPFVMILMTLVFCSPKWHYTMQRRLESILLIPERIHQFVNTFRSYQWRFNTLRAIRISVFVFFAFQLLFPFRYLLYKDRLFWKEQGFRFSWRVMLIEKAGHATFFVNERGSGRKGEVFNREFLTAQQQKQLAIQPDFILQYAHFLKKHYEQNGMKDVEVRAKVYVTLNGKPSRLYIDSNLNLAAITDSWSPRDWVMPYPY